MPSIVMQKLFETGHGADVLLCVPNDERQLKAHRFFLTEASPYFKTMLSVKSDSGKHVVASDMSFETLHLLIKHMYTGVLDEVTSVVQLKDLIKAAGCFDWDIRGYLALTINKIQTVSNSCEIANVELSFEVEAWNGWKHDELWDNTVYDFLCKNFNSIVAEETYLGLKPLCVNKIFSAPSIQIGSEMAVFKAIVLWVQHDFPGRHHHFPALLELVRYSKTTNIDFLMNIMLPWCSCKNSKRHLIYMLGLMCGHALNGPVVITARNYLL